MIDQDTLYLSIVLKNINLDDLFFDLENKDIAVGVSGGSDSMSLVNLLLKWNKINKIIAVTVDHGLRKESAIEALQVKKWMNDLKIEHHTLVWEKDFKITSKIQELARDARYALISNFCVQNSIKFFLTAHHANDLIETFFMRLKKGSTVNGLHPIKRVTEAAFGYIIRPFINILKNEIESPKDFINDPSNTNSFFERVRVREDLKNYNNEQLNGILKSLNHINLAKSFIEDEILKNYNSIFKDSILNLEEFIKLHPFIGKETLKLIIKKIGKAKYFISPSTNNRIYLDIVSNTFKATTAGHCLLKKISKNKILVQKENRNKD